MRGQGIFIGATGQDVGKTTICLGIMAGLADRYQTLGFQKPVGQQQVKVAYNLHVDKDVSLFKDYFHLEGDYQHMSPVLIPRGFTRDYLDGQVNEKELLNRVVTGFKAISTVNAFTVVEGTGHIGVGSIVGLSNARVAAALGLDMVIICSGGLGSAFDELAINIAMCREHGVKVRGIILNRVLVAKRDMILEYFPKALKRWSIPLLGCIPFHELLSQPSMFDFENLFNAPLLAGEQHRFRHFKHFRIGARTLDALHSQIRPDELTITPTSRRDIILATLEKHREYKELTGKDLEGGLILTGKRPPSQSILEEIQQADVPVLFVQDSSYNTLKTITTTISKIRRDDKYKVEAAIKTVQEHLDFKTLCGGSSGGNLAMEDTENMEKEI